MSLPYDISFITKKNKKWFNYYIYDNISYNYRHLIIKRNTYNKIYILEITYILYSDYKKQLLIFKLLIKLCRLFYIIKYIFIKIMSSQCYISFLIWN